MNQGSELMARRAFVWVGIAILVIIPVLLLWVAWQVFLVLFAGVLFAIFLRTISEWLSSKTKLSNGWSLAIVIVGLILLTAFSFWYLAPSVSEQISQLIKTLPASIEKLRATLGAYAWGRSILAQIPDAGAMISNGGAILTRISGIFSSTLGAIVDFALVLFVGIYGAAEPRLYIDGMIRLVPLAGRQRAREVFDAVGYTLRWWLIGRVASMILVGILTSLGLWLLGVPLALTFGLLAALLDFIPNIGPIVAALPAILLALTQGPDQAIYVTLLYVGIQNFEGFLLTPLIQERTVSLPPVLTLVGQVVLGVLAGGLGLALASPLIAVLLVLIKMLYVNDLLGDPMKVDGETPAPALAAGRQKK